MQDVPSAKPYKGLARTTRDDPQQNLFDVEEDWQRHWWGMPEWIHGNAQPLFKVVVNLPTVDALREFSKTLGIPMTIETNSIWFPKENLDEPKEWEWIDEAQISDLYSE